MKTGTGCCGSRGASATRVLEEPLARVHVSGPAQSRALRERRRSISSRATLRSLRAAARRHARGSAEPALRVRGGECFCAALVSARAAATRCAPSPRRRGAGRGISARSCSRRSMRFSAPALLTRGRGRGAPPA